MPRKGENIYKRKDGRWEGRYIISKCGKKNKYGYIYGHTYTEVKKKLSEKRANQMTIEVTNIKDETFDVISKQWLSDIKISIKDSTYIKYRNLLYSYILPYLGNSKISSLDYISISKLCNELLSSGGMKHTGLSTKTVSDVLSVIKSIIKYSARLKYTIDTSALDVSSKTKTNPLRVLTIEEEKKLINYLIDNKDDISIGIMICLFTGIRIGELCALTWKDISFENGIIHIHKTMQRIQSLDQNPATQIIITEPKSQCSIRDIPISNYLLSYLSDNKKMNEYVLTGNKYKYMEPRSLHNHFKKIIKKCEIESVTFHTLRHTFATRCIEVGFDIKSLSEILGHANVNITLNRYVHPTNEIKKKNMDKLSDLLSVK